MMRVLTQVSTKLFFSPFLSNFILCMPKTSSENGGLIAIYFAVEEPGS